MAVILAFVLILWAWGRFESFAICTGHGNGSKIDFIIDGNFDVAAYPVVVENMKTLFPRRLTETGLHNRYYRQLSLTLINNGFYC